MSTPTSRCHFVAILACLPLALGAQRPTAADTVRPAYENLRYREDWSRRYRGDPFDGLKRIELPGEAWMSLGGHARVRFEYDENYLGGGSGTRDDNFTLVRTYAHIDIHGSYGTRLFVEGRRARAPGRSLPGGERASDREDVDWGNVFAEITRRLDRTRATLRLGRQEMALGRERLVSPSDFSNVRRSFEGQVLELQQDRNTLTAFIVHPVVVAQTDGNEPDRRTTFWGGYFANRRSAANAVDVFGFHKENDPTPTVAVVRRTTLGARIVQSPFDGWQIEAEGGLQFGSAATTDLRAGMIATDVTRAWTVRWSPSLTLGADWSSGTTAGRPPQSGTWDILFPLGHSYLGYADVLSRRNVVELRAVAQAAPTRTLRLRASGHLFRRSSADDGIYDLSGSEARASIPGAPMDIGKEVDVTAQWWLQRHLRLDGGAAVFSPGGFMRVTGASQQYTWVFASLTAIF